MICATCGLLHSFGIKKISRTGFSRSSQYEPSRVGYYWNDHILSDYSSLNDFKYNKVDAKQLRDIGFGVVNTHNPDGVHRGTSIAVALIDNQNESYRIISQKVSWVENLKKIKKGPVIFFGNEFLDALPIKQFKKINNSIFERYVNLKKNRVNFVFKKAIKKQINKLKNYRLLGNDGIIEYPEYGFKELDIVCEKIKKLNGGALFIDYGYKVKKNINTLQSIMKHRLNDINKNIGNADITYLVNFNLYKEYFDSNNLFVENVISQSEFLQKMGIIERARIVSNKMNSSDKSNLNLRLQRLIDPKMMGENFKVIFAKNKKCKFSLAFR